MSSESSLRDVVIEAITNWASDNGGGFPTAFVFAVDYINQDGEPELVISQMDNQSTQRSMGLSTYLDQWYRDDAINHWRELWGGSSD